MEMPSKVILESWLSSSDDLKFRLWLIDEEFVGKEPVTDVWHAHLYLTKGRPLRSLGFWFEGEIELRVVSIAVEVR